MRRHRGIDVSEISVLVFAFFLGCARDHPCCALTINFRTRFVRACGVHVSLPSSLIRLADDDSLLKWFDELAFDQTHALLGFRCSVEVDWLNYFCVSS